MSLVLLPAQPPLPWAGLHVYGGRECDTAQGDNGHHGPAHLHMLEIGDAHLRQAAAVHMDQLAACDAVGDEAVLPGEPGSAASLSRSRASPPPQTPWEMTTGGGWSYLWQGLDQAQAQVAPGSSLSAVGLFREPLKGGLPAWTPGCIYTYT